MTASTLIDDDAVPAWHTAIFVALVPLLALIAGLVIRYVGYRHAVEGATLSQMVEAFCRWDCQWYVRLSEDGYDGFPTPGRINAGNWAFFPLYPMIVGALINVLSWPTMLVATLTSLSLAYMAVLLAWPLLDRRGPAYVVFAIYVLAGPFSIYFTTYFTEVLFLLLSLWVFGALRRSSYLEAGLATALLSATRIVGVFATLSLIARMIMDHFAEGGTWRSLVPAILKRPVLLLAIFICPLGLFAYMAFLHSRIGDGLAFSHVQIAWARAVGNPALYLWEALNRFPAEGYIPTTSQILGLAAIVGLVLTLGLVLRRQFPEAVFALVCIVLPMSAGMASMLRFMSALAPITVLAADLIGRNRFIAFLAILGMMAGCYYVTFGWFGGHLALV